MHVETLRRLSRLVTQQSEDSAVGLGSAIYPGNPPITRFESVDDVERIANDLELASGDGLTAALLEMVGVFYELALNAVEHPQCAASYYVIRAGSGAGGGVEHTVGVADCGTGFRRPCGGTLLLPTYRMTLMQSPLPPSCTLPAPEKRIVASDWTM